MTERPTWNTNPKGFVLSLIPLLFNSYTYAIAVTVAALVLWDTNQSLIGAGVGGAKDTAVQKVGKKAQGTLPAIEKNELRRGSGSAQVTLIEYNDFDCPFCQRHHATMQRIMQDYDGKVAWITRHFPLSIHPDARAKSIVVACATEQSQDAAWKLIDDNFAGQFTSQTLQASAENLVPDAVALRNCISSGRGGKIVDDQTNAGASYGVTGTPATVIVKGSNVGSAVLVEGAVDYEQLKSAVDAALK
jgi:protein-disulfide isomerase